MDKIKELFDAEFAQWKIRLPTKAVAKRERGKIVKAGWAIWYLFGRDETGEYLDYYSSHRMTNDRHARIYATGRQESLPAIRECYGYPDNDPVKKARLEAEFYAENKRVAAMLEAKGFGLAGDEPGGVQINRFLLVEKSEEDKEN